MKLTLYVSNAASTSGKPGEKQNVLRFNLPPKSDKVDDENAALFPDASRKSVVLEIGGLADEELAKYSGGKLASVTIELQP